MDVYIAICEDRHIDVHVRVFDTEDAAIEYAKDFCNGEPDVTQEKLTKGMIDDGWVFAMSYFESGYARVEKRVLNEK